MKKTGSPFGKGMKQAYATKKMSGAKGGFGRKKSKKKGMK